MAWNKGVLVMLGDLSKEFAAGTGTLLTGLNLRPTVTGWLMVVKRLNGERVKQILFVEGWTIEDVLEVLFNVVYHGALEDKWKDDKF